MALGDGTAPVDTQSPDGGGREGEGSAKPDCQGLEGKKSTPDTWLAARLCDGWVSGSRVAEEARSNGADIGRGGAAGAAELSISLAAPTKFIAVPKEIAASDSKALMLARGPGTRKGYAGRICEVTSTKDVLHVALDPAGARPT